MTGPHLRTGSSVGSFFARSIANTHFYAYRVPPRVGYRMGPKESGNPAPMHYLNGALAQFADATLVVDESGIVLFAGDQASRMLKYGRGELQGQSVESLMPERFRLAHIGHRLRFTDDRRSRPMGMGLELYALCKDGSECRVDLSLMPMQRGLATLMVVTIQAHEPP